MNIIQILVLKLGNWTELHRICVLKTAPNDSKRKTRLVYIKVRVHNEVYLKRMFLKKINFKTFYLIILEHCTHSDHHLEFWTMSQASPFDRAHFKRALCEAPTHISIKRDAARACFGLHLRQVLACLLDCALLCSLFWYCTTGSDATEDVES